jgi:hypothetical protein
MGSIFLDSEIRSTSTALFVQGIPMRISQQDMGSAVYQRGHARFSRGTLPMPECCGFSGR